MLLGGSNLAVDGRTPDRPLLRETEGDTGFSAVSRSGGAREGAAHGVPTLGAGVPLHPGLGDQLLRTFRRGAPAWIVKPTPRGWVLGLGSLVWFLVALVNHSVLPCLLACGGLGLCAASLLCSVLAVRGLSLRRCPASEAVTGQTMSLPLVVRNSLPRRRQSVVVLERLPFTLDPVHCMSVRSLAPGEERVVRRVLLAMRRGRFVLDRVTVRSGDPAGLFCCEKRISLPCEVLVLPGAEPLPNLPLRCRRALMTPTGSPYGAGGSSQEFYGVREYNPSDGLRHIHWKSSARFGRLMVREFERHSVTSVAVLLDANEDHVSGGEHWANLEYQVRAAASICRHVAGLYCRVAFAAGGRREVVVGSRPAARAEWQLLYELALLEPGPVPLEGVALRLGESLPRNTVVYCLSLAASQPLARALSVLAEQGMTVHWYCADKDVFSAPNSPRRPDAAQAFGGDVPDVLQMHPGMPLAKAFAHA